MVDCGYFSPTQDPQPILLLWKRLRLARLQEGLGDKSRMKKNLTETRYCFAVSHHFAACIATNFGKVE
ncbi:hypothetical protein CEXT_596201 [Caerostris extrusa]|uniref:Uncharacterized protein n=1 Tax=Caerostris extrusa TaxID=172846 RepID=A0AAV4Y5N8_CAEEX|nr:hypothetical protein CEXT_596201 [Caerostris extrusa]